MSLLPGSQLRQMRARALTCFDNIDMRNNDHSVLAWKHFAWGLQEEGLALFDLKAEPAGALFSDRIFRFAMPRRGEPMPEHALSPGDIILLSLSRPGDAI